MKKVKFFLSLKVQIFIFCLVTFFPILFVSSYLFHEHTKNILEQEWKNRLFAVTTLSSEKLKEFNIQALKSSKDIESVQYKNIKNTLIYIKENVPDIKNISIISKKDDENVSYILDSSTKAKDLNQDGKIEPLNEGLVLLGEESSDFRISTEPGMSEGFKNTFISQMKFRDKDRTWIKAYAPINNKKDTIISVEMFTDNTQEEYNKFMIMFRDVLIISFAIIVSLLFVATKIFLFPIKKLTQKVLNIRNGNFSGRIPFSWFYGEIGILVDSVNKMSEEVEYNKIKEIENLQHAEDKQKVIEITSKQIKSKNYELNNMIITLNTVNNIVEELIFIRDTKTLMDTVINSIGRVINFEKGFIAEYIPEEKSFKVISCLNTSNIKDNSSLPVKNSESLKKLLDVFNCIDEDQKSNIGEEEFNNSIALPLTNDKEIKGVIFLMNKVKKEEKEPDYFTAEEETTLRTLTKLVSAVWDSIHLFELATIDSLSKLYVRRYFEKTFEEELKKSLRNETNLSIIMIDIDNLQKCNNNYGHFIGDQVIKLVSESIKDSIDEPCIASRYGGEKFTILVPEKTAEEAFELAEEIRTKIEEQEVQVPIGDNIKITISSGVTSFPDNGETIDELLKSVESTLYKAKLQGKNKVLVAT